ncbi:MAG: excinuclease ABC subunit UvrA [Vampirovibrionales bacterium]
MSDPSKPDKPRVINQIDIIGARANNLKNITCQIPHRRLTVITGPSGSGKSSLAFDTLYAEGQRRFLASLSTYARQFLDRLDKPDVDDIRHVLPAIAMEQKNRVKNARSTVGTATEIVDFLRLLYSGIGQHVCPETGCGLINRFNTTAELVKAITALPEGSKVVLTAPVRRTKVKPYPKQLLADGYFRFFNRDTAMVEDITPKTKWPNDEALRPLPIVIDRLVLRGADTSDRLSESVQKALALSGGRVELIFMDRPDAPLVLMTRFDCDRCDRQFPELTPQLFSFNSPLGACPTCEGFGRIIGLDLDKVIPNKQATLKDGVVHPFNTPANVELQDMLLAEAKRRKIPTNKPYAELSEEQKRFVLEGGDDYPGVYPFFRWLERKKYKVHVRVMLAKYRGYYECHHCGGSRLKPEALQVQICGKTIHDCCGWPIAELKTFIEALETGPTPLPSETLALTRRIRREIINRCQVLLDVGLGYLTLSRQTRTLSGGESQRIHLSAALGTALTETLYVLDEPTVGLHAQDTDRLMDVLVALRDLGNTVVVVEHDPDVINRADTLIDLGPGGGRNGGHLVFAGPANQMGVDHPSLTARFLHNPPLPQTPKPASGSPSEPIEIIGATGHNLKNLHVIIPTGQLVCVTGLSGSGKSSLIHQTLYANYQHQSGRELALDALPVSQLNGLEQFEDVVMVDQSPIGQSKRSNPATYVKAYDEIRNRFAKTRQAQAMGITASHFSFNSEGGRCPTCKGLGEVVVDMQFLADVAVRCPDCQGKRFLASVLGIEYTIGNQGYTINDILALTIEEAGTVFADDRRILNRLKPLLDIGLGYLQLGQSTSTLSGGEAQRLKLASYLSAGSSTGSSTGNSSGKKSPPKPTLFLFDEPTTGLHLADIQNLVAVLRQLINAGHSVVVIEHHLEFIAQCDTLIDLGPGGGLDGGDIVAQGPLHTLLNTPQAHPNSVTLAYLSQRLGSAAKADKQYDAAIN